MCVCEVVCAADDEANRIADSEGGRCNLVVVGRSPMSDKNELACGGVIRPAPDAAMWACGLLGLVFF